MNVKFYGTTYLIIQKVIYFKTGASDIMVNLEKLLWLIKDVTSEYREYNW